MQFVSEDETASAQLKMLSRRDALEQVRMAHTGKCWTGLEK